MLITRQLMVTIYFHSRRVKYYGSQSFWLPFFKIAVVLDRRISHVWKVEEMIIFIFDSTNPLIHNVIRVVF